MTYKITESSRLVLGTAQLGMPYGIANKTGQPDSSSALAIIDAAWKGGIRQFDTAQGYGDSEIVLGKALHDLGISNQAKIISKLDPALDCIDSVSIERSVYGSLNNLKISCLHGLMMHREEIIDRFNDGIIDTLNKLVDKGLINNIGISVYSPHRAIQAMKYKTIKLIQLPANILDHRFRKYGAFDFAEQNDKIIYIRSIFLQGLILSNASELPEKIKYAQGIIQDLEVFCRKNGISPKELAINYIKCRYPKSNVVFGAETAKQVEDNIISWGCNIGNDLMSMTEDRYSNVEEDIINPLRWKN
jgi:aryl-alcohol dehydrogenase-like predicted oxidoreductase